MPWPCRLLLWCLAVLALCAGSSTPAWGLIVSTNASVGMQDETVPIGRASTLNCSGNGITCEFVAGTGTVTLSVSGLGTSGLADPGASGLVHRTSTGVTAAYAGTTCTNQLVRVLSAAGVATCVTVTSAYVDSSIAVVSGHLGQFAATTSAQLAGIISNETGSGALVFGTAPALSAPTGLVKSDVGLGNVDNTSDTTKNAAAVTLTNKGLDLASNTLTGTLAQFSTAVSDDNLVGESRTLTLLGTDSEIAVSAGAQNLAADRTWTLSFPLTVDLGGHTLELPNAGSLPGTCTTAQIFFHTGASAGENLYGCTSTNSWTQLTGGGGGGGSGDVTAWGDCTGGACGSGSSGGGTQFALYEALSGFKVTVSAAALTQDRALTLVDDNSNTVIPNLGSTHQFVTGIGADGVIVLAQPSSSDLSDAASVVTLNGAQKVTNKVIPPSSVQLDASSGTPTAVDLNTVELVYREDVSGGITIANPTGTPTRGQSFEVCLKSAAPQTVNWGTMFTAENGIALPILTTGNGTVYDCWKYAYNPTSTKLGLKATTTNTQGLGVTGGGTGLTAGTSGGVPYFSSTTSMASSAALTVNLPVIGGGAGAAPSVGTRSGTTTEFVTVTGAKTSGNLVKWDASGNAVDTGIAAGAGSGVGWIMLHPRSVNFPTSLACQLAGNENLSRLILDDTTSWSCWWTFMLPTDYVGTPTFLFQYGTVSNSSGTHKVRAYIQACTNSSTDCNVDSFDSANACDDGAVPTAAGLVHTITCALTNVDSMAAGNFIRLKIDRDVSDTATVQTEVVIAAFRYAK